MGIQNPNQIALPGLEPQQPEQSIVVDTEAIGRSGEQRNERAKYNPNTRSLVAEGRGASSDHADTTEALSIDEARAKIREILGDSNGINTTDTAAELDSTLQYVLDRVHFGPEKS